MLVLGLVVLVGLVAFNGAGRGFFFAGDTEGETFTPTRSQYLHWMSNDAAADARRAEASACRMAQRSSGGPVVLAVGRQIPGGVTGFATKGTIRDGEHLQSVVEGYVKGLTDCGDGKWILAVTTSNHRLDDVEHATASGRAWAEIVGSIASSEAVRVVGGIDMEPAWGTRAATSRWVESYRAADGPPLVFNASADGCAADGLTGSCANGWTVEAWASTIWSRQGDSALPQVYRTDGVMARQWATLARVASTTLGLEPVFTGVMTQRRACRQTQQHRCLDLSPTEAHAQLQEALEGIAAVPTVTDIGWG